MEKDWAGVKFELKIELNKKIKWVTMSLVRFILKVPRNSNKKSNQTISIFIVLARLKKNNFLQFNLI